MDLPRWRWPAWKFGLKQDDIETTLYAQYNTFSFSIQDPEAFHHDVSEISRDAETADEFHRLMADRKQQRLRELNESLESLAVEIIANPKLMKTDQWQHALQLFQSKSYDSMIRFFASYLPDYYFDRHSQASTASSYSETDSVQSESTTASSTDDPSCPVYLDNDYLPDGPAMTDEPECMHVGHHDRPHGVDAPLQPLIESEQAHTDESAPSPTDTTTDSHSYTSLPSPSRSMSFSDSESAFNADILRRTFTIHDDETSQSDGCDTAATSVSDCMEARSTLGSIEEKEQTPYIIIDDDEDDEFPPAQYPDDEIPDLETPTCHDILDSDTSTPRQEVVASNYIDYKSVLSRRLPAVGRRSPSPKPSLQSSTVHSDFAPLRSIRRSPDEARNKILKPTIPEAIRRRPKGRI